MATRTRDDIANLVETWEEQMNSIDITRLDADGAGLLEARIQDLDGRDL